MKIDMRPLAEIKPYEKNPRLNDSAVEAVARSISEFGFRQPIVVDGDGVIVVGHTRYKAAIKMGLTEVPVHVATDLTPAQRKAYRLADNATGAIASWDTDLLPVELRDFQDMDVDLSLLGFSEDELAAYLDPGVQEGLTDPAESVTHPGEGFLSLRHARAKLQAVVRQWRAPLEPRNVRRRRWNDVPEDRKSLRCPVVGFGDVCYYYPRHLCGRC